MEKIIDIVSAIASDNNVSKIQVIEILRESMIKMAKKEINEDANFIVIEDEENDDLRLVQKIVVCDDKNYKDGMESTHISFSEAKKLVENVHIDDELEYQIDLSAMNRNVVNNILQDIIHHIQKLNEQETMRKIQNDIGHLVTAQVIYVDENGNTSLEISGAPAIMPMKHRIKGEKFKVGQNIRCILKSAFATKYGLKIELSRTTPKLIEELLMLEVPEIKDGEINIHKIARIPGEKAKVALYTNNPRIDPIGSTVGTKGMRISAVSRELNGESIDCIEYMPKPEMFIAKALSPAQIISVQIQKDRLSENGREIATVQLSQSQKPRAIGKKGINIRLASLLTGYDFEIDEVEQKELEDSNTSISSTNNVSIDADTETKERENLELDALKSLFK